MNADLARAVLAILVLLAITEVVRAATRIVRGWDALAVGER